MKKILITGGTSLLGRYLTLTKPADVDLYQTWYTNFTPGSYQLDICNPSQVSYIFARVKPQVVIHLAAIGDVDYAQKNIREVRQVNVDGLANVIRACNDYRAQLILLSSNAVFAGTNPPYTEDSERHPVNFYGSTRREAEDTLRRECKNWLILRLFLLYGWPPPGARSNWAETIVKRLKAGQQVKLVNDTVWMPTYARDAAAAIWALIQTGLKDDTYHIAGPDRATLYEFGGVVAKVFGLDAGLLEPIDSSSLDIAPRPRDTTYDLGKLHGLGIVPAGLEEGLTRMRDEL